MTQLKTPSPSGKPSKDTKMPKKKDEHYEPNPKIKYPPEFDQLKGQELGYACHLYERFLIAKVLSQGPNALRAAAWAQHAFTRSQELMDYLKSRIEIDYKRIYDPNKRTYDPDLPSVG